MVNGVRKEREILSALERELRVTVITRII